MGPLRNTCSLEQLLENTSDGIFVLDRERRFVLFNSAAERITGYSRHELLGAYCKCHEALECRDTHGRSLAGALCPQRQLQADAQMTGLRQRMRLGRKDGSHVWVETSYTPLRDHTDGTTLTIAVMRDVTEALEHEQELITSLAEVRREVERLRAELARLYGFDTVISRSPEMQPVLERVRTAADTDLPVIVHGPAGCGKELIARTIHHHGLRRDGPFFVAACSAIPRDEIDIALFGDARHSGMWSAARNGTLLISAVTRLPDESQVRLLRALSNSPDLDPIRAADRPNPRLIVTMQESPAEAVAGGRLREDLALVLNSLPISVPALRRRTQDIPYHVHDILEHLNQKGARKVADVSPRAWHLLNDYSWPGNVRELVAAIQAAHAIGHGPILQATELPLSLQVSEKPASSSPVALDPALENLERQCILDALNQAGGQRNRAAQILGISRSRLYRRMEVLGITPDSPPQAIT